MLRSPTQSRWSAMSMRKASKTNQRSDFADNGLFIRLAPQTLGEISEDFQDVHAVCELSMRACRMMTDENTARKGGAMFAD
ncbi:MAG TPA: hypothetical protein VMW17_18390 [Candidatus Binatia bacterium]|nr:hypothetical protein [Candidatus Binatia bacterium]